MKRIKFPAPSVRHLAAAAALSLPAVGALAGDSPWYGSVSAGTQISSDKAINEGSNSAGTPSYGLDNSTVGGLAIGRRLGEGWRVEAELRYRAIDTDSSYRAGPSDGRPNEQFSVAGRLRSTTLMLNGIYDLPVQGAFKPYLKAGLGVAHNTSNADINITPTFAQFGLPADFRSPYPQGRQTSLAYAVGLGVSYAVSRDLSVDLGDQYTNLGKAKTAADGNGDVVSFNRPASHEVTLGLRYQF